MDFAQYEEKILSYFHAHTNIWNENYKEQAGTELCQAQGQ